MTEQFNQDHLSYSQINTYLNCPLKYRFQYVDKIAPAFISAALAFGSAIHEAAAAFYQSCLEGDVLRPDQLVDVYRQSWMSKGDAEIRYFNGDREQTLLTKAQSILEVFHDSFDPAVSILGVEEFFELPLEGLPPFHGYIDLIEQSRDGTTTIVDLKTASKKLSDTNAHSSLQLTAYSLGAEVLGFDRDTLGLRLDVLLKTKTPEMVRYETSRTEDERHRFIKLLHAVWNGIEQGVWFPRQDWGCVQCAYQGPCAEW